MFLPFLGKVAQQQGDYLAGGEYLELMGVLDIHYLITDVVGRLDYIDQRVARVAGGVVGRCETQHAQLVGHFYEVGMFRREKSKLAVASGKCRLEGIFDYRG